MLYSHVESTIEYAPWHCKSFVPRGSTTSASSAPAPAAAWPRRCCARPAPTSSCSRPAAVGRREGLEDVRVGVRLAAARRGDARRSRSANSTAASAAGTSRASRTRRRRADTFDWFRGAHARRPHQSLGPHLAAHGSRRFQAAAASTASATTGRSPTTTSSRTTTSSIASSGSSGRWKASATNPTASFCRRRSRAATSC